MKDWMFISAAISLLCWGCSYPGQPQEISNTESKSDGLPIYSKDEIVILPSLIKATKRTIVSRSPYLGFFSKYRLSKKEQEEIYRKIEKDLVKQLAKKKADGIVIISKNYRLDRNINSVFVTADFVKFIQPTENLILKRLKKPKYFVNYFPTASLDSRFYTYEVKSTLYHAFTNPKQEYCKTALEYVNKTEKTPNKYKNIIISNYLYYIGKHAIHSCYNIILSAMEKNECKSCAEHLRDKIIKNGGKRYIQQYFLILNNATTNSTANVAALAAAKYGGLSIVPYWMNTQKSGHIQSICEISGNQILKYVSKKYTQEYLDIAKKGLCTNSQIIGVLALSKIHDRRLIPEWRKFLKYHDNISVRKIAAKQLSAYQDKAFLKKIFESEKNKMIRNYIGQLLLHM